MKDSSVLVRTHLIRKALPCAHVHLGAPPGFGRTTLLRQMYSHFMRSGKTARKGCAFDSARLPLAELKCGLPPPGNGLWILAVDNVSPNDFAALSDLLERIAGLKGVRIRLFTTGPPLPDCFTRHRVRGTTLELDMEALAFTPEEARAISPRDGECLHETTAGWPFPFACLAALPPSVRETALGDSRSVLRTWMRETVLGAWIPGKNRLLLGAATLGRIDAESAARLGPPEETLSELQKMTRDGCPFRREEAALRMHPFMRRCLLSDLEEQPAAEKEWNATIRFHRERGDLLEAARVACEAGHPVHLAGILAELECRVHRIFDPELQKEFGTWLDRVVAAGHNLPSRVLSLMARYKNMTGHAAAAQAWAEKAVQAARSAADAGAIIRSTLLTARILRCRNSLEQSDRLLEALEEEFPAMTWTLRYTVCAERAYNRILECEYRPALSMMHDLMQAAAEDGHRSALWARRFLTLPYFYLGRYGDALSCFEAARALPEKEQMMLDRHGVHIAAAKCLQILGYSEEALALVERQLRMKSLLDDPDDFWMSLLLAAEIEFGEQEPELERGRGDLSRVREYLSRARSLAPKNLENGFFQAWHTAYSHIVEAFSQPETMDESLREALRETRDASPFLHAMLLLRASSWLLMLSRRGRDAGGDGNRKKLPEIVDMLYTCLDVCDRIGCGVFVGHAHAVLAVIYDSIGLRESARTHLKAAFAHFERESQMGLFRATEEMGPLVRLAREEGLSPEFTARVAEAFGYPLARWKVKLFGKFEISRIADGGVIPINRSKVREALAYLVHHRGRTVSHRELASALWPGAPPVNASRLCSVALSQLRRIMRREADGAFFGGRGLLKLNASEIATDAEGLESLEEIPALLPRIERNGQNLREEFERLRLAPLREGYLGEFASPWARAAARDVDALVARIPLREQAPPRKAV